MSDFISIWTNFFDIVVDIWYFLINFADGIIIALIVLYLMAVTLKRIFFGNPEEE